MATKREAESIFLVKSHIVFNNELSMRISLGQNLYAKQIKTVKELETFINDFESWNDYNIELIKRAFNNHNSQYYNDYKSVNFKVGIFSSSGINPITFSVKLQETQIKITNCLNNLKRLREKLPLIEENHSISIIDTLKEKKYNNSCFLIHGHNDNVKLEVSRFIENDLSIKTIILHEQPNKGRTVIEKFEDHSKVDFAVALWTADDIGLNKKESLYQNRVRQNVLFETGFFFGKLGRKNVIVIYEEGVEIPSDYKGVIYIPYLGNWKYDLQKEINAIYKNGDKSMKIF